MADTENEDLEIVEIPAEGEEVTVEEKPAKEAPPAEDDDEDDDRLAQDDGDEDDDSGDSQGDDAKSAAAKKRKSRHERQKRAREADAAEKAFLRQQLAEMQQRLNAVEGTAINTSEFNIDQRLQHARQRFDQAEEIMARAVDAGNGEDMRQALRIRDAAALDLNALTSAKEQVTQMRDQASQPRADPRAEHFKNQWLQANSTWFDGRSEDSQIALAIDRAVAGEGYDPASPDYWREVSRRCAARFGDDDGLDAQPRNPRRKPPPQSQSREHVPDASRDNKIYVTPEQKQAMIEAGYWDDPVKRNRILKSYQDQKRQASASR